MIIDNDHPELLPVLHAAAARFAAVAFEHLAPDLQQMVVEILKQRPGAGVLVVVDLGPEVAAARLVLSNPPNEPLTLGALVDPPERGPVN